MYRQFLNRLKTKAIREYKVQDVLELLGKGPPEDVNCPDIWKRMVEYWDKPEQRKKSAQAREARMSTANTPDGQIAKSGFGRMSASDKILREVKF